MEKSQKSSTQGKPVSATEPTKQRVKGVRPENCKKSTSFSVDRGKPVLEPSSPQDSGIDVESKTVLFDLPVHYNIRKLKKETIIHREMKLEQYMKCKFVMHSPTQHTGIIDSFKKNKNIDIRFSENLLCIDTSLINKGQLDHLVEKVIEAVETHAIDLSIKVYTASNSEECVQTIMKSGFAFSKTIYAETINGHVASVFLRSNSAGLDNFIKTELNLTQINLKSANAEKMSYSKNLSLDPLWSDVFQKLQIKDDLVVTFPRVKLTTKKTDSDFEIYIVGPEQDVITCVKTFKDDYESKITHRTINFRIKKMEVFEETNLLQTLEFCLKKNQCHCILTMVQSNTQLQITACNMKELNFAEKKLKRLVCEERVIPDGKWREAKEIRRLQSTFEHKYEGVLLTLDEDGAVFAVTGFKTNVDKLITEMQKEMNDDHGDKILRVIIDDTDKFIVLMNNESYMDDLKTKLDVQITPFECKEQHGFTIKGSSHSVEQCQAYITDNVERIKSDVFLCTDTREESFFRSEIGSKCILKTGTKHQTLIKLRETPLMCVEEKFEKEKERKTWKFQNGQKLVAWRQSVTQSEANIVVKNMEVGDKIENHNIGVAYRENGETTMEGNVFIPMYTRDKRSAERKLKAALTSVLKVAERDNEESVAFPLKEVKSWPIEKIQRALISSCAEYFMAANEDNEPRFVIICIDDEDLFLKYLESLGTFIHEFDTEASSRNKQALRILVKKGSLNETKADVIVNTTSSTLDLTKGAVSAALYKTAGYGMQRECQDSYPRGVKAGDVVVTGGYHLKCNCVFHGTIPIYKAGKKGFEHITKFMHNCLVKAVEYKATTIAFPAIGTGNLQYPVEAVATEMFNCVREFQQSGHNTFLKEVLFVIYHSDDEAFEVFKKQEMATPDIDPIKTPAILELVGLKPDIEKAKTELRKKCDSSEGYERQTNRKPVETDTNASVVARNGNKKEENKKASIGSNVIPETLKRRSSSDAAAAEHKPVDIQQTKIKNPVGNIYPLFVETGNILECKFSPNHETKIITTDILSIKDVEAIVCSENRYGNGLGKVAKKLETLGKTKYTDDKYTAFKRNPEFGDVVITSGGRSRYKWILHAIVPDRYGEKGWKKTMQCLFDRMFEESSKCGFNSMATSLLGTGKFGGDQQRCAEVFLDSYTVACNRYHDKPLTLHMVNIDTNITQAVISVFKSHIKSSHDKGPVSAMPDVYDTQSFSSSSKRESPRKRNTFGRTISDSSLSGTISEAGLPDLKKKTVMVKKTEDVDDNCVICMDTLDDPKTLKCGHTFCTDCIDQQFKFKQACPTCGTICGIITGDQPDGKMEVEKSYGSLAGYQGIGSIVITYTFNSGQQSPTHPRPGTQYKGITRTAYLPDNEEGRQICAMLRVAFDRKLVFTIGASRTTGQEGVITWNDIHHKTDQKPNTQFGYPDATYLARVTDELGAKGVTKSDIEKKFLRILKSSLVGQRIK